MGALLKSLDSGIFAIDPPKLSCCIFFHFLLLLRSFQFMGSSLRCSLVCVLVARFAHVAFYSTTPPTPPPPRVRLTSHVRHPTSSPWRSRGSIASWAPSLSWFTGCCKSPNYGLKPAHSALNSVFFRENSKPCFARPGF